VRSVVALTVLAIAASVTAPGTASEDPGGIRYDRRLTLPAAGDAFEQPLAVHADLHTGEVFVCDLRTHRIVIFDADGLMRYQIRGGRAFRSPLDIAVDPSGRIVLLARRGSKVGLLQLDFDGLFLGEIPLTGLPDDADEPRLTSVALSPTGDRLYVIDSANLRLWVADYQGRVVSSFDFAVDFTPEEALEIQLGHVDVYEDTVLVGLPTSGSVQLLDLEGKPTGRVGSYGTSPCTTARPVAAALDSANRVIVVDRQRMVFNVWDRDSNRCLGDNSGIGKSPGRLYAPADIALDTAGRVYVSQGFEGRVQVYDGAIPATAPREQP
jgi:DNA-binding beta-propeller fold protein YncE